MVVLFWMKVGDAGVEALAKNLPQIQFTRRPTIVAMNVA
jgi:hypothetical protein